MHLNNSLIVTQYLINTSQNLHTYQPNKYNSVVMKMLRNFSNYAITKKKLQQTLLRRIGRQSLYINNRQLICIPPIRSNSSFPTAQSLIIVSQKMESSKIANSPLTNIFNKNTNLHLPIQSRKILRFQLIIVITVKFVQSITTPARASVQIS